MTPELRKTLTCFILELVLLSLTSGEPQDLPCCPRPTDEGHLDIQRGHLETQEGHAEIQKPPGSSGRRSVLDVFPGDPRGLVGHQRASSTPPEGTSSGAQARIMNRGADHSVAPQERAAGSHLVELMTRLGILVGSAEFAHEPTAPPSRGRPFFAFRGIPYASPPLGRLRWREPEDLDGPWPGGRLDASQHKAFCPQYDYDSGQVIGQEDCLYLNVYTPINPAQTRGRLPVIFFLHGGSYLRDTAASLGPQKLLREDVILVTANFRIGILGFLSTRSEYLAGNYGLLDQLSALRWVQRNIAQFGGDPNRVTLGGFDSGASAVHLHMMSPLSKGLFHSAIMMSGAGNCVWSTSTWPETAAYDIGYHMGCSTWSSWYLRECLLDKSPTELIQAQAELHRYVLWPMMFRPSVDGDLRENPFLPEPLEILTTRPPANPVPLLLGGVPDEGILFALTAVLYSKSAGSASQIYEEGALFTLGSLWPNDTVWDSVLEDLVSFYYSPQAKENLDVLVHEMSEAFTDLFFTSCIWDAAQYFASSRAPVFTYLMTHRLPTSPSYSAPLYMSAESVGLKGGDLFARISHGDDLALIFSLPFDLSQPSPEDQQMSALLTFIWATFAHTGSPQGGSGAANAGLPLWTPLVAGDPANYFSLSFAPGMSSRPFRNKERNFWSQTFIRIENARRAAFAYSVSTWLLLTLCLLLILVVCLVGVCVWKARRKNKYPGGSLTLRRRISRNPSALSSESRSGISSNPRS